MKKLLDSLDIMERNQIAVFCGAGISKNSGLPLAQELKGYLLSKLQIEKKDIKEIMVSNLPFEIFMETISEQADISELLNLYKIGKPNVNHFFLARLAKKGYFKTIFTTNFDVLIEDALLREGLKDGRDFRRYFTEEHFSSLTNRKNTNKLNLIKIHGCINEKESVRITMRNIASNNLSGKRMGAIEHLFSNGKHKRVLILGYSCSDLFDITPQIQSVEEKTKEVILIQHQKERGREKVEGINFNGEKNPFKNYPGKRISVDTDKFIRYLWQVCKKAIGEYKDITSSVEWRTLVDNWINELKNGVGYLIAGAIFLKISNSRKAINYLKKSLAREVGDEERAICYGNLGSAYRNLGNFKKAIAYHRKSVAIAKFIGSKVIQAKGYGNMGVIYGSLGNYQKEIGYHKKSMLLNRNIKNEVGVAICYTNLGVAYDSFKDFKKGFKYHNRAISLSKNIGDKSIEAKSYLNLGHTYYRLGDHEKRKNVMRRLYRSVKISEIGMG